MSRQGGLVQVVPVHPHAGVLQGPAVEGLELACEALQHLVRVHTLVLPGVFAVLRVGGSQLLLSC